MFTQHNKTRRDFLQHFKEFMCKLDSCVFINNARREGSAMECIVYLPLHVLMVLPFVPFGIINLLSNSVRISC